VKCEIPDCQGKAQGKGLCGKHYMRLRRTGDANVVRQPGVPGSSRKHPLYGAWAGMVNRCHNPNNSSFSTYGAVGIYVCQRWRTGENGMTGFECYLADMGERPEAHTLDRIEATGPYAPGNCRWATATVQRANLSVAGKIRASVLGSKAKRKRAYSPLGRKIEQHATARGESLSRLSDRLGFAAPSFLFSVCCGLKKPSPRLRNLLMEDGFAWPSDEAKVHRTSGPLTKMEIIQ